MGLLDGIGLVVLILITIVACNYCYRCCCTSRSQTNPAPNVPRRRGRQKNARRKRRRRHPNRTPNQNNEPRLPSQPNSQPPGNASSQCNVDIYSEEPQPVLMYPQYPPQPFQGQTFPQVHPSLQNQPYQQFQSQPYPFQNVNLAADHSLLLPPPYESHQQGQFQNFGVPSQSGANFFAQAPPPPYDTQLCPQTVQQNRQFEDADKKN